MSLAILLSLEPSETWFPFLFAGLAAFLMGLSKAGLKGLSIFNVTLMALAFGAKSSTGLIMPLLLVGDIFAVIFYGKYTQWRLILRFLPYMVFGILIGVFLGQDMPESIFKPVMVSVILLSLGILIWWDQKKNKSVPTHWSFTGGLGILAGVCTMMGNLAGAMTNIYFFAMRLPKNEFVGTAAWLFFITNFFKLPFHIWRWKTISVETLWIDLKLFPIMVLGLFSGLVLVKKINEKNYKRFILVVTAFGALVFLLR